MDEKQLIFLISQPRSGSTLTQKIIGSHSKIYTRGEPWLMLPPAYTLKDKGLQAEYNASDQKKAFNIFLEDLPEREKTYIDEVKKMNLNLYSKYLEGTEYTYFLDKTPRYYLITDELQKIFPHANYILLIRNPLAVLGSMITTWTKNNWKALSDKKYDLIDAIDIIIEILENQQDKYLIVYYEKLISHSEEVVKNIFEYLNLSYESETLKNYNNNSEQKWAFGDPSSVYEKNRIDPTNDTKWQKGLNDPQYWRIIYDYLIYIGEEKFTKLGYDYIENMNILNESMPATTIKELMINTISLNSCLFAEAKDIEISRLHSIEKSLQSEINTINTELASKRLELESRNQVINKINTELASKRLELESRNQVINKINTELASKRLELESIYKSKTWKLTNFLAKLLTR